MSNVERLKELDSYIKGLDGLERSNLILLAGFSDERLERLLREAPDENRRRYVQAAIDLRRSAGFGPITSKTD